jgi:hypothetical protein
MINRPQPAAGGTRRLHLEDYMRARNWQIRNCPPMRQRRSQSPSNGLLLTLLQPAPLLELRCHHQWDYTCSSISLHVAPD